MFEFLEVNSPNGVGSLAAYGNAQRGSRLVSRGRSIQNVVPSQFAQAAEPINLNDKAAIIFPDQLEQLRSSGFAKDSYGNPVTPFPLSDDDVKQRNGAIKDPSGILLPSYASGIIGFVDPNLPATKLSQNLEPPQSNGNFYYPGVNSETSTEFLLVDRGQNPSTIAQPSDNLLPPFETNFNGLFNQPPPKPDTSTPNAPPTDLLPPFQDNSVNRILTAPQPSTQAPIARPTPPPVQIPVAVQPAAPPTPPKKVTSNKYTGGFGGAPGLLSPQNNGGFVKPEPNKAALVQPIATQKPQVVIDKVTIVKQPIVQVPNRYESSGTKYTGGFGGPPGFLTPFDNINRK